MANPNNGKNKNTNSEKEVDVLYQKLGERWFAFSIIEDEVFMSPIEESQINEIRLGNDANNPGFNNEAA